jgi:hypothetical protein
MRCEEKRDERDEEERRMIRSGVERSGEKRSGEKRREGSFIRYSGRSIPLPSYIVFAQYCDRNERTYAPMSHAVPDTPSTMQSVFQ